MTVPVSGKYLLHSVIFAAALGLGIVIGTPGALADPPGHDEEHPRPIPMGVSISNVPSLPFLYAGTAGMLVRSLSNASEKFILSNNHVAGTVGPNLCPNEATPGVTRTIQPGTLDLGFDPGGDTSFDVGVVADFRTINFSFFGRNLIDAAIISTTEGLASREILGIGEPTPALGFPAVGMDVIKSGRTTGVTTGSVTSIHTTVNVNYGASCGGSARFVNQAITTDIGDAGDSGSVVLQQGSNIPVGLYFAGSATTGVMNPILAVYLLLGVFVDSGPASLLSDAQQSGDGRLSGDLLRRVRDIKERHEDRLMGLSEVAGVGVGLNEAGDGPAIVIYLKRASRRARAELPQNLDGVPVRVIESGEFVPH